MEITYSNKIESFYKTEQSNCQLYAKRFLNRHIVVFTCNSARKSFPKSQSNVENGENKTQPNRRFTKQAAHFLFIHVTNAYNIIVNMPAHCRAYVIYSMYNNLDMWCLQIVHSQRQVI